MEESSVLFIAVVALAFVVFGFAGYHYLYALGEVQRRLPVQFRDHLTARSIIDDAVWNPGIPASARRSYLISLISGTAFLGLVMFAAAMRTSWPFWVLLAGITILATLHTIQSALKYRRLAGGSVQE